MRVSPKMACSILGAWLWPSLILWSVFCIALARWPVLLSPIRLLGVDSWWLFGVGCLLLVTLGLARLVGWCIVPRAWSASLPMAQMLSTPLLVALVALFWGGAGADFAFRESLLDTSRMRTALLAFLVFAFVTLVLWLLLDSARHAPRLADAVAATRSSRRGFLAKLAAGSLLVGVPLGAWYIWRTLEWDVLLALALWSLAAAALSCFLQPSQLRLQASWRSCWVAALTLVGMVGLPMQAMAALALADPFWSVWAHVSAAFGVAVPLLAIFLGSLFCTRFAAVELSEAP